MIDSNKNIYYIIRNWCNINGPPQQNFRFPCKLEETVWPGYLVKVEELSFPIFI